MNNIIKKVFCRRIIFLILFFFFVFISANSTIYFLGQFLFPFYHSKFSIPLLITFLVLCVKQFFSYLNVSYVLLFAHNIINENKEELPSLSAKNLFLIIKSAFILTIISGISSFLFGLSVFNNALILIFIAGSFYLNFLLLNFSTNFKLLELFNFKKAHKLILEHFKPYFFIFLFSLMNYYLFRARFLNFHNFFIKITINLVFSFSHILIFLILFGILANLFKKDFKASTTSFIQYERLDS